MRSRRCDNAKSKSIYNISHKLLLNVESSKNKKKKMWRMNDVNDNFLNILVVIVRIVVFDFIFSIFFRYFFCFYFCFCRCRCFYCDDFFFDFFVNFVFDCKFEMFYVTIVNVVIKKFAFTILFDFLNDCYDVIFDDIILRKFVEINNKINNQKNKIVIVDDNNFKKLDTLSFVNMNDIWKNEFEFVSAIIIEEFMLRNSTINEKKNVF